MIKDLQRREFIKNAVAGTALVALGGALYRIASDDMNRKARAEKRGDRWIIVHTHASDLTAGH